MAIDGGDGSVFLLSWQLFTLSAKSIGSRRELAAFHAVLATH